MMPHSWEGLEVSFAIFLLSRFRGRGEEVDGLAGEGCGADEVAVFAIGDGRAGGREGCDCHSEAATLDFACIDGEERTRGAEKGDDVSAACDGTKINGGGEGGVHVFECTWCKR